jgi:hypothetical protein
MSDAKRYDVRWSGLHSDYDALRAENDRLTREQGEGTTSNKYRAELYDEVWQRARDMGFANVTMALAELAALKAVPDGVEVVGVVCVSRFRNSPAMENVEFQQAADIPQGQHDLMTVAQHNARMAEKDMEIERLREECVELDAEQGVSALVEAAKEFADAARKNIYPCPDKPGSLSGKLQALDDAIAAAQHTARMAEKDAQIEALSAPAPAAGQGVSALVELLSWLRGAIDCNPKNDTEKRGAWISTKHPMIERIDAALAAHKSGGDV